MITKTSIIKKLPDGKYRLYSRKKDQSGKRKNLGTYDSLSGAKEREKQVQYFKHHADDGLADDKQTKMLGDLSDIATYLEEAGFVDKADKVYAVMAAMDGSLNDDEDYLVDHFQIPDNQLNIENQGFGGGESPIGGGYGMLGLDEAMRAEDSFGDKKKLFEEGPINFASSMDPDLLFIIRGRYPEDGPNNDRSGYTYFICAQSLKDFNWYYVFYTNYLSHKDAINSARFFSKNITKESIEESDSWEKMEMHEIEQDNVDVAARSNGLQGNTSVSNNFQGLSGDSAFFRPPGSIEENM